MQATRLAGQLPTARRGVYALATADTVPNVQGGAFEAAGVEG
jgi:hypothetical protein